MNQTINDLIMSINQISLMVFSVVLCASSVVLCVTKKRTYTEFHGVHTEEHRGLIK